MDRLSFALATWSLVEAHCLYQSGSYGPRVHLHGAFSNSQARDLALAWRLHDPRTDPSVQYQYCSARVLLSNHLAFVVAGWTDADSIDPGDGAEEPRVSLYICVDHGDSHRVQIILWGQEGASERTEAMYAFRDWHTRTVGPHGPRLIIPRASRHVGDMDA
jgi:hypothetical protein